MNNPGTDVLADDLEEKRLQGIKIKLPGGTVLEIRGLTTIMALLLVLTGVNSWIGWTLISETGKMADAVLKMSRAQTFQTCVIVEIDPNKRLLRYEECAKWFEGGRKDFRGEIQWYSQERSAKATFSAMEMAAQGQAQKVDTPQMSSTGGVANAAPIFVVQ